MDTIDKSINKIIMALFELEAKGCHSIFYEYGNGLFRVRIIHHFTEKVDYEGQIDLHEDEKEIERLLDKIEYMTFSIRKTPFQCFKREFVKGRKAGKWEKIKSIIELGDNATESMLEDGSGYYLNDPDNDMQYFVDYKQLSETDNK